LLKRILVVWVVANLAIPGLAALVAGGWYLGWEVAPAVGMVVELCLMMGPNAVLPALALHYWWPETVADLRTALGWRWPGWRCVAAGVLAFLVAMLVTNGITRLVGGSIPYNMPNAGGGGFSVDRPMDVLKLLGVLVGLLAFVALTVLGEETMFRGWIQTQLGHRYGAWVGFLVAALLFGLRHLPADLFYAGIWEATPRMWLARQLQLYVAAVCLGLARHLGRSTYASAITHGLLFGAVLFT
jgi:membrane protease YdiL (CAAX protease family)